PGLGQFLLTVLAANANELGGALPENSFTGAELAAMPQKYAAQSMVAVTDTQTAVTQRYQAEAVRMAAKLGSDHPRTVALAAQADAGAQTVRALAVGAEVATVRPPAASATTAAVSGRLVNTKGQGQEGFTVELVRPNATRVETIGRTDASGFFATVFDDARTTALAREGDLLLRVVDSDGKEVMRATDTIRIAPGADSSSTLTVPVRMVPRSAATAGAELFTSAP